MSRRDSLGHATSVDRFLAGPASAVFVSRGLGEAGVPLRVDSPPGINVLTLIPG